MKRILCLLAALLLLTVTLCACQPETKRRKSRADDEESEKQASAVVPNFVGMTVEEINHHENYGDWVDFLSITLEYKYSETVDEGIVIEQSLEAGLEIKVTDSRKDIVLTISKGQKLVRVPSVVGMRIETATRLLEQAGLVVQLDPMMSENVEERYVIAVNPPDGELPVGTVVLVTYSTGNKQLVEIPELRNLSKEDALALLQGSGLTVVVEPCSVEDSQLPPNTVLTQSISTGSRVPKGSTLVLYVTTETEG